MPGMGTVTETAVLLPCQESSIGDLWFADCPTQVSAAKALCQGCPVRSECLQRALEAAEPWGVWGGELFAEGVVIAAKRSRGRPRKEVA